MAMAVAGLGAFAASAGAAGTVTFPGGPSTVSVGAAGAMPIELPNVDVNNFYPPIGNGRGLRVLPRVPPLQATRRSCKKSVYGFQGIADSRSSRRPMEYTIAQPGALYR